MATDRWAVGYEPNFDADRAYGFQAELWTRLLSKALTDGAVEVKHDAVTNYSGNMYIELEHRPGRKGPWKPSGLNRTKADVWMHVVDVGPFSMALAIPVEMLRIVVERFIEHEREEGRAGIISMDRGGCPTRGVALPIGRLVTARLADDENVPSGAIPEPLCSHRWANVPVMEAGDIYMRQRCKRCGKERAS